MKMIDISEKPVTKRTAWVEATVVLKPSVIRAVKQKKIPKGDVLEAARLAGILAAKKTSILLPLCHPVPLEYVELEFVLKRKEIVVKAIVEGEAKTGVEMEAFTAASVACLTIYDMCKSLDRAGCISGIKLLKKTGGRSGSYERAE